VFHDSGLLRQIPPREDVAVGSGTLADDSKGPVYSLANKWSTATLASLLTQADLDALKILLCPDTLEIFRLRALLAS